MNFIRWEKEKVCWGEIYWDDSCEPLCNKTVNTLGWDASRITWKKNVITVYNKTEDVQTSMVRFKHMFCYKWLGINMCF